MELRITKFDGALRTKLKVQALKSGKTLRQLVIDLLREAVKSFK